MTGKCTGLPSKPQKDLAQENLAIYEAYETAPYLSIKHSSYFHVYEKLISPFRNRDITFVEVGVFHGGSLFMWRNFLGPQARIIGVEFNPGAKRWEKDGFEIHIGDQSDVHFWENFYRKIGPIDVLLDDGGHSNEQQIVTVSQSAANINNGGLIIVEDTHTSYMSQFGNPSKYSFMNFSFDVVDSINSRFPAVKKSSNPLAAEISSVEFHESIVSFRIDRLDCFASEPTSNDGEEVDAIDYRHHGTVSSFLGSTRRKLSEAFSDLDQDGWMSGIAKSVFNGLLFLQHRLLPQKQKKYFG